MPFSKFTAFYDPETLALLTHVFDEAWPEFQSTWPSTNESTARELLAGRIMQAHKSGERDVHALKAVVLRGYTIGN